MDVFDLYSEIHSSGKREELSLQDFLLGCRDDPLMHASAAERMVSAIGEPEMVDTSRDPRLGRIFLNRTIKRYPAFEGFFGMEETIERIVGFFQHASQGLEERKQVLYLLGPVGGGKSSLAERLKSAMEVEPIYVLKAGDEISPVFESPINLFDPERMGDLLEEKYGIPRRRLTGLISPWAVKRLDEFDGDISNFSIVKLHLSKLRHIGVAKTEPGDENNQDILSLVGKLDIRKLEHFSQNDPDAYSYSGGLNRTTQGMLEFVEMFKAPIKVLHPLLTATQEQSYIGTENFGAFPYHGTILAHSNEAEWRQFKSNKNNEAFLDRISVIKVPYCLRVMEETENPIVRLVMEIIQRDSHMHYRVQGWIADSLEGKTVSLTPDEISAVWGMIEDHIKLERKTLKLAEEAAQAIGGSKGMLIQSYLLEYLMEDEKKHNLLLDRVGEIQKGMFPYG